MTALSTSAWVLHDLGLAAGFGGSLFGNVALNPAVREIHDPEDRSRVLQSSWGKYSVVNGISLGTAALTWVAGRALLSGFEVGPEARGLVIAKDVLLGGAVVLTAANIAAGIYMRQYGDVPVESGHTPAVNTPAPVAAIQQYFKYARPISIGLMAGVIGVTAALAMKSGKSMPWSFISRLLP